MVFIACYTFVTFELQIFNHFFPIPVIIYPTLLRLRDIALPMEVTYIVVLEVLLKDRVN